MRGDDGADERVHRLFVAHIAGVELVRSVTGPARASHYRRTLVGENLADSGTDPADAAGNEDDATLKAEVIGVRT